MFKLVIVEDEDNIRHSLECFIPWDKIGFQVVGAFGDGSDALAYLREHPCDAVLTDILMSRMSGLEMIQQLHEIHPGIKVVILSGHSDFGYAQRAITYQVAHYLVKPVDEDELISVFRGLSEQLASEAEENIMADGENRELKQMLQRNFFRDLLLGNISSEQELDEYLKLLGIAGTQKSESLLAFELECKVLSTRALKSDGVTPADILGKCCSGVSGDIKNFCYEAKPGQWQLVFLGKDNQSLRQFGSETLQNAIAELNAALIGEFSGHLTHNVLHLTDLLTTAKIEQPADEAEVADYKLLVLELDLGNEETLGRLLERTLFGFADLSTEDMLSRLQQVYSGVESNYRKRKIDVREITNGRFCNSALFHTADREELLASVTEDFLVLCRSLKNRPHKSEHNVISRIVQHLDAHLDEDISHDMIAAKHRLHPGYLSRLFKQEMGETLSEYILRIRIERAAQLLKEDRHKIGEIALKVGYSTSSYFSVMFKKYAGCSPREYCQRVSP